jgi:hypothetical protein
MFPGQIHKNCIIGGATGISLFGIYATYSYTQAKALKAENKKLKQELYELKRQKWVAENSKSEPESAINKYDSYDLTDENNKQYSGEKQAAPKLVLSDLPPLNMISEDEGEGEPVLESAPASAPVPAETSTSEQTAPTTTEAPSPDVQPTTASAVDVLYRHESCTCQTPRNVIIGMIDLFVLASAVYIYIFTTHLNRQCPA